MYIGDSSDSEYGDDGDDNNTRVVPVFLEGEKTPRCLAATTTINDDFGSEEEGGDIVVSSSSSGEFGGERAMTPVTNNKEFKRKKALQQAQRRKMRTTQGVISTESERPISANQVASPRKKSALCEHDVEKQEEEPVPTKVKKAPKAAAPRYEEMPITTQVAPVQYKQPVVQQQQQRQVARPRHEVSSDSDDDTQEQSMEEDEEEPRNNEKHKRKRPQVRQPRQGFAVSASALAAESASVERTRKEKPRQAPTRATEAASRIDYPTAIGYAAPSTPPVLARDLDSPLETTIVGSSPEAVLAFITNPAPKSHLTMTKIQLVSKGRHPVYMVYLEDSNQFLLSARKRRSRCSNYLISSDPSDLERNSSKYLGKVRSNFMGTEFTIYDKGINPKKGPQETSRTELACVAYNTNVLGLAGPRKMLVLLPSDVAKASNQSLLQRYKSGDSTGMTVILNKAPVWNEATQAYVLNFHRRVKIASVKNFQLVEPTDHDNVLLQFGRVTKTVFTLDYKYPFTLLQAFGIALTSFDKKIACE